jgi:hypothetical protein
MGNTLIVEGRLRGMGCEIDCLLIATRSESANAANVMFTRCTILDAPLWLPDGYYEAVFSHQSAFLHRLNGVWSVGIPWRQDEAAAAESADYARVIAEPGRRMQAVTK